MYHSIMLPIIKRLVFVVVFVSTFIQTGLAASYQAKMTFDKSKGNISELKWKTETPPVKIEPFTDRFRVSVSLEGQYTRKDWNLVWNNKKILLNRGGSGQSSFRFDVSLTNKSGVLVLTAVGPLGEVEKEKILISIENWEVLRQGSSEKPTQRYSFTPGLSLSYISYQEVRTDVPSIDYSAISLTAKINYLHSLFSQRWDIGGSVFFTLLPISQTPKTTERFLGVNLRVGCVLPKIEEPWRFSILVGWYYVTTFVTSNAFGFKNMMGPQLFPTLRKQLKNGDMALGYIKFSPVSTQLSLLNLANHELAVGVSYLHPLQNLHPLSFSMDLSNFKLEILGVKISSTTVSVGAGYGF